jgi:hypothetical protein
MTIAICCSATCVAADTRVNPFYQAVSVNQPTKNADHPRSVIGDASAFGSIESVVTDRSLKQKTRSELPAPRRISPRRDRSPAKNLAASRLPRRLPPVLGLPQQPTNALSETLATTEKDPRARAQTRRVVPTNLASHVIHPAVKSSPPARTIGFPSRRQLGVADKTEAPTADCDLSGSTEPPETPIPSEASPAETPQQDAIDVPDEPQRRGVIASASEHPADPRATRRLQSVTTDSCSHRAAKSLADAYREYSVAAWASAEASAWKALELIATGVDVDNRVTASSGEPVTASRELRAARTALRESRDFLAAGAAVDDSQFSALASAHQTPVFNDGIPAGLTPSEAADRYLDHARVQLASLAQARVQAAQAMDLLAAIQLGRNETQSLPEETALCLRRAALQGQPTNASLASRLGMQLADMGLDEEAEWTLSHAMSLEPSDEIALSLAEVMKRRGHHDAAMRVTSNLRETIPRATGGPQIPEVIQLSPAEFASISPAVNTAVPPVSVPAATTDSSTASSQVTSRTAGRTATEKPATPRGRFTASLAGFRLPFRQTEIERDLSRGGETPGVVPRSHRPSTTGPTTDVIDERADGFETTDSPIQRLIGKMPKLW